MRPETLHTDTMNDRVMAGIQKDLAAGRCWACHAAAGHALTCPEVVASARNTGIIRAGTTFKMDFPIAPEENAVLVAEEDIDLAAITAHGGDASFVWAEVRARSHLLFLPKITITADDHGVGRVHLTSF